MLLHYEPNVARDVKQLFTLLKEKVSFCERSMRSQHATKYGGHILAWDTTIVLFLQPFKEICLKIQDGELSLRVNYYFIAQSLCSIGVMTSLYLLSYRPNEKLLYNCESYFTLLIITQCISFHHRDFRVTSM